MAEGGRVNRVYHYRLYPTRHQVEALEVEGLRQAVLCNGGTGEPCLDGAAEAQAAGADRLQALLDLQEDSKKPELSAEEGATK